MHKVCAQVRSSLGVAATAMAWSANRRRREHDITVGSLVWVRTQHLALPARLTRKLAAKFIGPFQVLSQVNQVAFRVDLPEKFNKLHNVFHVSQLKLHVSGSAEQMDEVRPDPIFDDDPLPAYEVEDILDVRKRRGRGQHREFLVKWKGFSLHEATWEREDNLDNCPEILQAFL